jgi:hypothetical protein
MVLSGERKLLQVVGALRAGRGFANLLHRRQQESDQDGDDRDHHQKLDQRECDTPRLQAEERGHETPRTNDENEAPDEISRPFTIPSSVNRMDDSRGNPPD